VALDPADDTQVYVAASHNSRIDRVDTVASILTWYAGGSGTYGEGLVPKTAGLPPERQVFDLLLAGMSDPTSLTFGPDGTLYFSDAGNQLVRKIAPGSQRVEIVAGSIVVDADGTIHLQPGYEGDGGDALLAKLHSSDEAQASSGGRIVVDGNRLLVADTLNGVIRSVDLDTGIIDTFAGLFGVPGYAGDGGDALEAVFNEPNDVAVGIDGEVYVADTKNHCVRVVHDGIVDTFAGICDPDPSAAGDSGDGGLATEAEFSDTFGVEVDAAGDVYIADSGNHIVRRVRPIR
jgi:sugar lactone lactonase YvrE